MINTFRNYGLLLVVFIHAHIYLVDYAHLNAPYWLESVYAHFLCYFHPASILAAISGYLFYKDFSDDHAKWRTFLREKYLKRIKSILFPYLFWVSFLFIVNNLLIYLVNKFDPGVFVNSFHEISLRNYIKAFFYPQLAIAEHLWYLNNLLFAFIGAPLLLFLSRYRFLVEILFCLIMVYYWWQLTLELNQASMVIKYRFIIFFLGGAVLALNRHYLHLLINYKLAISAICMAILILLFVVNDYYHQAALLYVFNSLTVPVLIFYFVYLILSIFGAGKDAMYKRSNHFLLYIIHPLLLSLLCKLLNYAGVLRLGNYFIGILAVVALSFVVVKLNTFIYHVLSRYFKSFTLKFL